MSKPTIVRLFLGSIVAFVASVVLGFVAVFAAYAGGAFVMDGPDVAGLQPTPFAAAMVAVLLVALFTLVASSVAGLVAWIGALLNTAQLDEKIWFLVLLALGVWNLGIVAMFVYVIAGPDGQPQRRFDPATAGAAQ